MKLTDQSVIRVTFDGTGHKGYAYYCPFEVSVGDRVIVDAPSSGYTTVTVSEVGVKLDTKATKRIVATIDDSEYLSWKEKEDRRKELLLALEKRRKVAEEIAIFEFLAQSDSEVKAMLEELKSL